MKKVAKVSGKYDDKYNSISVTVKPFSLKNNGTTYAFSRGLN